MGMESTLHVKSIGQQGQFSDGFPLGYTMQSSFNMELTNFDAYNKPRWISLDGSDSSIDVLGPDLKKSWPVGVFTSTARTLPATPAASVVASSPTYFVASAAAGTTAGMFSTDAATWSQASLVSPASCQVNCLLFTTGASTPRWVFGCSGSANPCVTTGDNPNTTWTACTGAVTTTLRHGLAHSPSLNLTLLIPNGAGTAVWTMPGTDTIFTTRAVTSASKIGGCWDGTNFVVLTATAGLVQRSSTGTSGWTDVQSSGMVSNVTDVVSDGAGTIVAAASSAYAQYVMVSTDSGSTWAKVYLPAEANYNVSSGGTIAGGPTYSILSYANGKFFINSTTAGTLTFVSVTGKFWAAEPIFRRGIADTQIHMLAWKSSVYAGITTSTAALSATEAVTSFRRPACFRGKETTNYGDFNLNNQEYMKVRL